ncbi:origin recognition complex subunit 1 [Pelomyxa schiedti]|nr:origin recognition complex subunit 1 [Pelomyxa schiedti]
MIDELVAVARATQQALSPLHKNLLFDSAANPGDLVMKGREAHLKIIKELICDGIRTQASGSVYLCGIPGTGKTSCVRCAIASLKAEHPEQKFTFIDLNAFKLTSPEKLYVELCRKCNLPSAPSTARAYFSGHVQEQVTGEHPYIVVFVDEIDCLINSSTVFIQLYDMTTSSKTHFFLIAASNKSQMPNEAHSKLISRMGVNRMLFNSYTADELQAIVQHRMHLSLKSRTPSQSTSTSTLAVIPTCSPGATLINIDASTAHNEFTVSLFSTQALHDVAVREAMCGGDSRKMLNVCAHSITIALEDQRHMERLRLQLSSSHHCNANIPQLVEERHLSQALRERNANQASASPVTLIVRNLPPTEKLILAIALSFSERSDAIPVTAIYTRYTIVCESYTEVVPKVSLTSFLRCVEHLMGMQLLLSSTSSSSRLPTALVIVEMCGTDKSVLTSNQDGTQCSLDDKCANMIASVFDRRV